MQPLQNERYALFPQNIGIIILNIILSVLIPCIQSAFPYFLLFCNYLLSIT